MGTIGLSPDINNLGGFLASSGVSHLLPGRVISTQVQLVCHRFRYVRFCDEGKCVLILAVYDDLIDPPFINEEWAAGQFQAWRLLSCIPHTDASRLCPH